MKLVPDDDDSFEFKVSDNSFSKGEEEAIFSDPLDDPDLHKRCKDKEICGREECTVYTDGSELTELKNNTETYDDIISELEENI